MEDAPQENTGSNAPYDPEVFNRRAALERVEGDWELLEEVVEIFLEDCPALLADLEGAVGRKDAGALEEAAHRLKGSVGNFGAQEAFDLARRLEELGKAGSVEGAAGACDSLVRAVAELEAALRAFVRERKLP